MKRQTVKRYIHTLVRRVSFLEARVQEMEKHNREPHRDKAELNALNYAIGLMREEYDNWGSNDDQDQAEDQEGNTAVNPRAGSVSDVAAI